MHHISLERRIFKNFQASKKLEFLGCFCVENVSLRDLGRNQYSLWKWTKMFFALKLFPLALFLLFPLYKYKLSSGFFWPFFCFIFLSLIWPFVKNHKVSFWNTSGSHYNCSLNTEASFANAFKYMWFYNRS